MLCCIRHSFSNMVHPWNYLPFVTYPLKTDFSVAPGRDVWKNNHWCLFNRLGSNVKPDSALNPTLLCVCFLGVCFLLGWGWLARLLAALCAWHWAWPAVAWRSCRKRPALQHALPAVSHVQRTSPHSFLSPYSPKASDCVRPLLSGDALFGSILSMNLKRGVLLMIPVKNAPSRCFPDHHTTLIKWLVFWAVSTLQVLFCVFIYH